MESKDSFIFKRAGYRKSYAMQNKAGLHDFVLGGASFMQRRRFFYSVLPLLPGLLKWSFLTTHTNKEESGGTSQ